MHPLKTVCVIGRREIDGHFGIKIEVTWGGLVSGSGGGGGGGGGGGLRNSI